MYPIALGLVIRSNAVWGEVNAALRDLPYRVVLDHPEVADEAALLERIERLMPDVLLVEFGAAASVADSLIPRVKATSASPVVVALQASRGVESVVAALRAGVDQFLFAPFREKLGKALERAQQRVRQRPRGKVFAFLSAKGGCGATTIACHTAIAIGRHAEEHGKRALLVDLDLNTGMVRFLMRSENPYSVADAIANLQRLDFDYWQKLTVEAVPGLEVIAAPADLASPHTLNRDQVQHVLSFARTHYGWTIIDLGRGLGLLAKSVLCEIDELYIVTTHEIPAVHLTRKILEVLQASHYPRERVRVLVNRAPNHSDGRLGHVLGLPVYAQIPNDYGALFEAYSAGQMLSRRSRLGRQFERLAGRILGVVEEEKQAGGFSLREWLVSLGVLNHSPRPSEAIKFT